MSGHANDRSRENALLCGVIFPYLGPAKLKVQAGYDGRFHAWTLVEALDLIRA